MPHSVSAPARLLPRGSSSAVLLLALLALGVAPGLAAQSRGRATQPAPRATPTPPAPVPVTIRAAIVLPDLSVRPLPLHALEIVADASGGVPPDTTVDTMADTPVAPVADAPVAVAVPAVGPTAVAGDSGAASPPGTAVVLATARTGLDGTAQHVLVPGRYRVRSVQPVTLNDSSYRWDVAFEVEGAAVTLELTNANASVVATSPARPATVTRHVAPEREAFERVKRGVFRVEAGLGHGTGFLIALPGVSDALVVTNDHVVSGSTTASVYLDTLTRVPAQVVIRDQEADLAVLRLPAGRCADCPRLEVATPASGEPLVVAGERVLAIGFPLSQEMTLTTGVASSVRDGAIISDVNINPGNSGGPMLTVDAKVVGINTFGEGNGRGPGVSGAVAATRLATLLGQVPAALAALEPLEDRTLPTMPRTAYPLAALKSHADTVNPKGYRKLLERGAGTFLVSTTTPVLYRVAQRLAEAEVAGDRRKREQKGNVAAEEQYSEANQARDWEQYVGDAQTPVVAVTITPRIGETFWSSVGRGLQAAGGAYVLSPANMKFQGDVRGARFYRNGEEIVPLRGGHGPQAVRIDNAWVKLKDVADMGYYVLPVEAFAPDSATGAPARVTIVVQDLKNPRNLSATDIENDASARIWNDFGPYFQSVHPDRAWRAADAKRKSPKIPLDCDARTATCERKER